MSTYKSNEARNANRDPITGEPGAHPVGAGVGAAIGGAAGVAGAAAAGAALGTVAGPAGTIAGAVVGGVVGGLVGSDVAEDFNPTLEETYWSNEYSTRPYIAKGSSFDTYRPAYRYGIDSFGKYKGKRFNDIEPQLSQGWSKTGSSLSWDEAKPASRDAYDRLSGNANTQF